MAQVSDELIAAMRAALDQARDALNHDDVPVGAVVLHEGKIIAARHNERENHRDPTAHAEVLALLGCIGNLGRVQQGLGGDATAVQAGAAELVLVDEDDGLAEFGCAQCARVTAAARSEEHTSELQSH